VDGELYSSDPYASPDWYSPEQRFYDNTKGNLGQSAHTILQLAGLVPAAGEVFDLIDSMLYAIQGDPTEALLSLASAFPVGGQALFSARLFRRGLEGLTSIGSGLGKHAHHVFPKKFSNRFSDLGLDINDPRFGAWWDAKDHLQNSWNYNNEWEEWFLRNPNGTAADALTFAEKLAGDYGFTFKP
jgi:hypothetical protein